MRTKWRLSQWLEYVDGWSTDIRLLGKSVNLYSRWIFRRRRAVKSEQCCLQNAKCQWTQYSTEFFGQSRTMAMFILQITHRGSSDLELCQQVRNEELVSNEERVYDNDDQNTLTIYFEPIKSITDRWHTWKHIEEFKKGCHRNENFFFLQTQM
jgi:hypothetical protein